MKNKAKQYTFIALVLVIIVFSLYFFVFNRKLNLNIVTYLPNTQVIINREKSIYNSEENKIITTSLKKGDYEIIVAKEGYFPWTKKIELEDKDVTLEPFMVSQYPSGQIINENDPEYFDIKNKISTEKIPTLDNPKISKDNSTKIWVSNKDEISFKTDSGSGLIIKSDTPIKNVEFYKDRNDVIIFSTEKNVYAMDIYDSYNIRNFMPVYTGTDPDFITGDDPNFIYVKDTNSLMIVMI
ncbi:MAG: PEGA domain-containing protein [Candidatus Paceibacterota bacterium]